MQGKVVVITGGTSGIGQVAAERLAAMGARIVLVARSQEPGRGHACPVARDCSRRSHTAFTTAMFRVWPTSTGLARRSAAAEPRIDVLINNAGAMFGQRQVTEDGLELTFATNHLSYFVLTHGLRERLMRLGAARVVNTSSHAHYRANDRFRRSAIRARLQSVSGLLPLKALQHPVHSRAGAAAGRNRCHRQQFASGICEYALRRPERRRDGAHGSES